MELPGRYFDNNVVKTVALLAALDACDVHRVVFSSSCSVYGTPTMLPVDEQHPLAPESPYAESKLIVERDALLVRHSAANRLGEPALLQRRGRDARRAIRRGLARRRSTSCRS